MNSHGTLIASRLGAIIVMGACLTILFAPVIAFSQPGRTYTPPPPPPPPPSPPPRPYIPQPPPPVNTQQSQMMQQMNRESTQRDTLKTRQDYNQIMRASQPTNPFGGGGFGGAPARNVMVEVIDVIVTTVEPNTQAARLGLRKGDILVSYAGQNLVSTQLVQNLVKLHANDVLDIELVVIRNNQTLEFDVQPGRLGVLMRVQKQFIVK